MIIKDNLEKVFTDAQNQIRWSMLYGEHLKDCTDIRNNYMYMYSDSDYDYFKCINHREYLKVTSN